MTKVVVVRNVEDFEKIRKAKGCDKLTVFILNDVDFEDGHLFLPIDLSGTEVCIYGLGNTINNLTINNVFAKQSGLFSCVKNLFVKKLKVTRAKVIGDEICGVLAGRVDESFIADELYINSEVNCYAISGGVIGVADTVYVNDSTICTTLSGKGVLGGLAGMAENCFVNESNVDVTFKPVNGKFTRKNMIDSYVGYLGERENPRVEAMVREVCEYLEEKDILRLTL